MALLMQSAWSISVNKVMRAQELFTHMKRGDDYWLTYGIYTQAVTWIGYMVQEIQCLWSHPNHAYMYTRTIGMSQFDHHSSSFQSMKGLCSHCSTTANIQAIFQIMLITNSDVIFYQNKRPLKSQNATKLLME